MNYCRKCGAKLEDNDKFCSKCGNSILGEEVESEDLIDKITKDKMEEEFNEFNQSKESTDDKDEIFNVDDYLETYTELHKSSNDENEFSNKNSDSKNYINLNEILDKGNNKKENYNGDHDLDLRTNDNKQKGNQNSNNNLIDKDELKNRNKKKIIILSSILSIAIIVVLIFLFKDNLLYKVYIDKANSTNVVSEKLINYNKALKYEYDENIKDSIYDVVKNEADFLEQVNKLDSLKQEDLNKLVSKIYIYNIKKALDNEDYKLADRYLEEAKSKNYKIEEINNYNELAKSIDDKKNEEKKIKEEEDRVKEEEKKAEKRKEEEMKENERLKQEKLSKQNEELSSINDKLTYNHNYNNYDFIVSDSHIRYMTEKELGFYDKYTLGLIRNEIYARHGYVFSTQPYKSYFENKSWYYKDYNFKGTPLNKYEKANVDLILREEKRR